MFNLQVTTHGTIIMGILRFLSQARSAFVSLHGVNLRSAHRIRENGNARLIVREAISVLSPLDLETKDRYLSVRKFKPIATNVELSIKSPGSRSERNIGKSAIGIKFVGRTIRS